MMSSPPFAVSDPHLERRVRPLTAAAALKLARDAMARWRGGQAVAPSLPRGTTRVSLQASHLEQTRRNLIAWRALGGFAQDPCPPAPCERAGACID